MIQLLITGTPSTVTAQQKGVKIVKKPNWRAPRRKLLFYTKSAVEAEARRMKRNIHLWDGHEYVRMKALYPTPFIGPLRVTIKYVFPLTQEQAARHAANLSDPAFEINHGKRPDWDNLIKKLFDVLTELHFWEDDAQIDDAFIFKRRGTTPRIVIVIQPAGEVS